MYESHVTLNKVNRVVNVNLEPTLKVMNVEVVNHNGILQSKGMIDLRLLGWNGIILILRKFMMSLL